MTDALQKAMNLLRNSGYAWGQYQIRGNRDEAKTMQRQCKEAERRIRAIVEAADHQAKLDEER